MTKVRGLIAGATRTPEAGSCTAATACTSFIFSDSRLLKLSQLTFSALRIFCLLSTEMHVLQEAAEEWPTRAKRSKPRSVT
jgi:hypothetical protein